MHVVFLLPLWRHWDVFCMFSHLHFLLPSGGSVLSAHFGLYLSYLMFASKVCWSLAICSHLSGELKNCKLVGRVAILLWLIVSVNTWYQCPRLAFSPSLSDLSYSLEKLFQSLTWRVSLAATILVAKHRKKAGPMVSVLVFDISFHLIFQDNIYALNSAKCPTPFTSRYSLLYLYIDYTTSSQVWEG